MVTSAVDGFNVCIFAYGQVRISALRPLSAPPPGRSAACCQLCCLPVRFAACLYALLRALERTQNGR